MDTQTTITGIIAIITTMGLIAILIVLYFMMLIRKARQRHEEAMALIERGQYDPGLLAEPEKRFRKETFLLAGIIFLAIGIAVLIGLWVMEQINGIIAGLIPCFIGVGLLIFYAILGRIEKGRSER